MLGAEAGGIMIDSPRQVSFKTGFLWRLRSTGKEIADAFSSYLVRGLLRDLKGNGSCTST